MKFVKDHTSVPVAADESVFTAADAVTERGRKHLHELVGMIQEGHRGVMLYIVQRGDGSIFKPAEHIDPEYVKSLQEAYRKGVEILVYRAEVNPERIEIIEKINWKF